MRPASLQVCITIFLCAPAVPSPFAATLASHPCTRAVRPSSFYSAGIQGASVALAMNRPQLVTRREAQAGGNERSACAGSLSPLLPLLPPPPLLLPPPCCAGVNRLRAAASYQASTCSGSATPTSP